MNDKRSRKVSQIVGWEFLERSNIYLLVDHLTSNPSFLNERSRRKPSKFKQLNKKFIKKFFFDNLWPTIDKTNLASEVTEKFKGKRFYFLSALIFD